VPSAVNNCRTNRLNCASSTMNDCRCREVILCIQCLHMSADRVLRFSAPEDTLRIYTCARILRRSRDNACRRDMHGKVAMRFRPGIRPVNAGVRTRRYATAPGSSAKDACRFMHECRSAGGTREYASAPAVCCRIAPEYWNAGSKRQHGAPGVRRQRRMPMRDGIGY
jgi:hypothetical protein